MYRRICRRCGAEYQIVDYHKTCLTYCDKCLPTRDQLHQWYVIEFKTKREILDLVNADYSSKISFTTLKRLFLKYNLRCKEKKELRYKTYIDYFHDAVNKKYENKDSDEVIECKICGVKRKSLVTHITRVHKLSNSDYRNLYNTETISKRYHEIVGKRSSIGMKAAWKEGRAKRDNSNFWHRDINESEKILQKLSKNILYVGGNKKGCKNLRLKTSYYRNPDFVVINDESYLKELESFKNWYDIQNKVSKDFQEHTIKIDKIVEFNGYYWHSLRFNGRTKEEYEKDMIQDYKLANVDCLVVWDNELKDLQTTKAKIDEFVQV